ncbi:MAG: 1-acyl-sn-glycerol-3-phosphate acyltransferase [Planctomycetes bacterium B3_Pla]|nr:MAG: 1-acyl-sn-glycerol-3-phosphate acyltransferase [Planctomycetes bacterium B3_Pla]
MARIFNLIVVVLMNLWVYPLLIIWTLIGSLITFPALLVWQLITGWPRAKVMRLFIWIYGRGCILIFRPFVRLECKDMRLENLPRPGIIIMNHNSFFDTYMLSMLPCYDAHVCLRSWPFKMFWYSLFMRMAEYLDLESSPWEEILTDAERVTRGGRYLIIFPEGHRSRTGKPGRFHSGAFKLAVQLKVPILPLCTTGTQTLLPPKRWWIKPARIKMQMLEPVLPDPYHGETAHIEMRKHVQKQMIDAIEQLESN